MRRTLVLLSATAAASAQAWVPQQSGTTANLRGVSAVNAAVAWASGAKGTFLRTADSGATWKTATIPGAADLDFRGVWAIDAKTAFLLSSGPGEKSRIYKTADAGANWQALRVNPDPKGFWDAIAMWDPMHGIVVGDPVKGRFTIYLTSDGVNWQPQKGPPANAEEGVFAASNSSLFVRGLHEAWFGTGGPGGARVLHTEDGGKTWNAAKTPVRNDSASAGIFSVAFSEMHGVAVGGDYMKAAEAGRSGAISGDGGKTWSSAPVGGYRSAVAFLTPKKMWIATGLSGSDVSMDGKTWKTFDSGAYNALSFTMDAGWAVGPNGAIAKLKIE
ncbi:MAG TPA: hypothetical protein VEV85_03040 [Bryobacteraceae bacterium]|nr:hypothetical protein [Bryobacteraceae bacterium]